VILFRHKFWNSWERTRVAREKPFNEQTQPTGHGERREATDARRAGANDAVKFLRCGWTLNLDRLWPHSTALPNLCHCSDMAKVAEGVGFEPTLGLLLSLISSQVPSTTQPPFPPFIRSHSTTQMKVVDCDTAFEYWLNEPGPSAGHERPTRLRGRRTH
jgi:hypothetical protein